MIATKKLPPDYFAILDRWKMIEESGRRESRRACMKALEEAGFADGSAGAGELWTHPDVIDNEPFHTTTAVQILLHWAQEGKG